MSFTIAVAGKGGTGKTTVAALLVSRLAARGKGPVLAVDADPNSCLDAALGVTVTRTVGAVRENARRIAEGGGNRGAGVSKPELLEVEIAESLVEAEDFDLIAMGRSEGPGCYCWANAVIKQVVATLADRYPVVVVDNEAGLENLSRRILHRADLVVMVADPSALGLRTVKRLHDLANEMGLRYERLAIVVNRMRRGDLPPGARELQEEIGADFLVGLPEDGALADLAERGGSVSTLPGGSPLVDRLDRLLEEVGPR